MRIALNQAKLALEHDEVPVGCVIVLKDEVIAKSFNRTNAESNATRHCEICAIDEILNTLDEETGKKRFDHSIFSHCVLYVTVEPCIMCASALSLLRFGKVYFGCHNDRFGGCGSVLDLHDSNALPSKSHLGLDITSGILKEEAIDVLKLFYSMGNPKAPDCKRHRSIVSEEEKRTMLSGND